MVATKKALSGKQTPREDNAKHCCFACSGFLRKPQLQAGLAIRGGVLLTVDSSAENTSSK